MSKSNVPGDAGVPRSISVSGSASEFAAERDFLLRSIDDLEREHAAGDVSDDDFTALRASYVQRAAEVLRALGKVESFNDEPQPASKNLSWRGFRRALGRRRVRRVLGTLAVICFVVGVGLFAAALAGVRLPGQDPSGSIALPTAAQVSDDLTEAQVYASSGNLNEAITLYDAILQKVPDQAEALAYRGWLERLVGIAKDSSVVVRTGDESIAEAIHVAPSYPDARAFEVIVLFEDDHATGQAQREYRQFETAKPSKSLLTAVGPQMALAFHNAHVAVPGALAPYA